MQSILNWFPNHARLEKGVKIPHMTGKVTFNSVLRLEKKKEIEDAASELSGAARGSQEWLGKYQSATKFVRDHLDDEEKELFEKKRQQMEENGVPEELQIEYVTRSSSAPLLTSIAEPVTATVERSFQKCTHSSSKKWEYELLRSLVDIERMARWPCRCE